MLRVLLGLVSLLLINSPPWRSEAFNIETKHYAVYRNEASSMFGFSVTVYRDKYGRGWTIVGAPEAETTQAGVYRGGAVYRCDIATDDRCEIIHFDDKGNNHVRNPSVPENLSQIDNKTLQWFGATVSASINDGGPILACAPRYIWFSVSQPRLEVDDYRKESVVGNRREPVGTCWVVSNNFNDSQEFSPCRTRYWGYHRQGSCQAGLGASMSKNGERLFIGAPGSWYWQGQAFSQSLSNRARVMFTKEGPANEDDSYMGYAVATGDFVGNGDSGTAVGVPRGSGLRGKVVLFTSNMTNYQNVSGEQMGAYFGYSVASGDIDGDGLDDLIVGAPMYTVPENPEMTIETGRVYVFYQGNGPEKLRKVDTRDGESNRGRFGLSLASLGDLDHDGFGDIAVGAPYAGPNGRGAVYIYHGSRTGIMEKYSQVIHAEDLDNPVETFGFSVAGGLDLDGNHYPDLVVGAYESSAAMFFRARPVIKMDSFVIFESESKLISLERHNCVLTDGTAVTCLPLKACFKYSGDGVLSRHNFDIQYVLDVKKTKSPRMFFLELEGRNTMNHTITVEKDLQFCRTVKVYVTPNIRDKLTSLDAEMRMSLAEERQPDGRRRDPRIPLRPVLGATTSRKDSLAIRKNCGPDNICIPDLSMTVKPNVARYLLGSEKTLELDVLVRNEGEDAFESTYNLKLPAGINYIKIERLDKTEVPVQCSAPKQSNNNTLKCDIGNPLPQKLLVHFKVLLQPVTSHSMNPLYEFDMDVNTTNPENTDTIRDNTQHISLPIWIETELLVEGESKPKDLYYNPDNYTAVNITTEMEFGPAVTHNYTIRNQGPSNIIEAEAFLIWPAQTLAGDELLYLLEQPETSGPIACEPANANYLSLKLDHRRKIYIHNAEPSGVILDESQSGKTINVQRGFEESNDRTRIQKEETEISSGDSSGIQKSRHQSSSSSSVATETKRVQLTPDQNKSGVISTSYTQNSSGSSSTSAIIGGQVTNNRGLILNGGYDGKSDSMDANFHSSQGGFDSSLPSVHETQTIRTHMDNFDEHWDGTDTFVEEHRSHSTAGIGVEVANEKRYQDVLRQQKIQRIREEEQRLLDQRRKVEEERLRLEVESRNLRAQQEAQRKHEEDERIRLQELHRRRLEEEERLRQQEKEEEEKEDEYVYGTERKYGTLEERNRGSFSTRFRDIVGDREDSIGSSEIGIKLRNVSSIQELDRMFKALSQERSGYNLYDKQGIHYVQFMARFRTTADKKEFIELQDGSMFPLEDRFGSTSYLSGSAEARDGRFLRIDGQLMVGQNGKGYIVLNDGRRFPLQGSYTYTEERTYTIGGGSRGTLGGVSHGTVAAGSHGSADDDSRSYERSWHEESSSHTGDNDREYEASYSRAHEERRTEERRVNSRVYDRDYTRAYNHDNVPTSRPDPNHLSSRFRRESDMVDVEKFKKLEKHRRRQRNIEEEDSLSTQKADLDYDIDSRSQKQIAPCDAAKCVTLRCVLGPLKKDEEVYIAARYRVKAATLKKVANREKIKVSTQLVARVTKQPYIGTPAVQVIKSDEAFTNVEPSASPAAPDIIPLWVVVLSACAGAIILLLLIFLLHKCGFFKRNRPSDAPERQPLNRNGHFQQGDDH
ncbi:integrin alpha-PS2 isoform X2 [Prorops nasuta]|uniref:integrin alpha-PS2 isoform X2 n=1 Tax=Prorops nasuta TaxID=863751 RepID=UPI0034CD6670